MDSVEFEGVTYVRAAVAAKQFSYTQDYVGQLCRSKKVDARLVGRSWFVNPRSLEQHQAAKKNAVASSGEAQVATTSNRTKAGEDAARSRKLAEGSADMARKKEPKRRDVPATLRRSPTKFLERLEGVRPDAAVRTPAVRHLAVSYEPDQEALLPTLQKIELPPPAPLLVRLAEASTVRVRARQREQGTTFAAEPIPEVRLQGELSVTEVAAPPESHDTGSDTPDSADEPVAAAPDGPQPHQVDSVSNKRDMLQSKPITAEMTDEKHIAPHNPARVRVRAKAMRGISRPTNVVRQSAVAKANAEKELPSASAQPPKQPVGERAGKPESPDSKQAQSGSATLPPSAFTPARVASDAAPAPLLARLVPLAIIVLAVVCGLAIVSVEQLIDVSASELEVSAVFMSPTELQLGGLLGW